MLLLQLPQGFFFCQLIINLDFEKTVFLTWIEFWLQIKKSNKEGDQVKSKKKSRKTPIFSQKVVKDFWTRP